MSRITKALLKAIDNPYASLASNGLLNDSDVYIDTGCYALNAVISGSIFGGMPINKIIGLAGEEATGKTFFTLALCKHFQSYHPEAEVVYFESEGALTEDLLRSRKIDLDRLTVVPIKTAQQFKTQALRSMEIYKTEDVPVFFVLDSLGNLSTAKEVDDSHKGNDVRDMTRSQILKAVFRVLALELAFQKIPLVCTNHVYDVIGAHIPLKEMGGGSGLKYTASIVLFLHKSKALSRDVGGKSDEKNRVGSFVRVRAKKSRLVIEEKEVKVLLRANGGLDPYFGLFDICKDAGLVEKDGKRWKNTLTGEIWWGKDILNLSTAPKFYTQEMLEAIDEHVQKTFKYGDIDDNIELEVDDESILGDE